jgi:type I restriction enzyme S subunit
MKLHKYTKFKDLKIKWLPAIPENWSTNRISYTTYVKGRIGWQGLKSDEFIDEGPFLVTGTDFDNGEIIWKNCYHIAEERFNEDSNIHLMEGDLLITKDGTIGKIAIVKGLPDKATLNSGIFLTRPINNDYNVTFMYWVLNSSIFLNFIEYTKLGTTISHLYQHVFNKFIFPLPLLAEQLSIAAFLDRETARIDALIGKKKKLIELLKEKRTALITRAVTKGLNKEVKMKPSGIEWLGDIPEHWEVKRLKDISVKIGDGLHATPNYVDYSDFYFINGNNLEDGKIRITGVTRCVEEDEYSKYRIPLTNNAILLSLNGTIGNLAFYNQEKVIFGKSAAYIDLKQHICREFVLFYLESNVIQNYFGLSVTGTTIKNLSLFSVRHTNILLPPIGEQNEIVNFIKRELEIMESLSQKIGLAISKLQEYRTAIISAAVTGKIRVGDED